MSSPGSDPCRRLGPAAHLAAACFHRRGRCAACSAPSRDINPSCWFPSSGESLGCAAVILGRSLSSRWCIAVGSGVYAATHFAITTDINKLISPDLGLAPARTGLREGIPGPVQLDPGGGRCADAGACDRGHRQPGGAAVRAAEAVSCRCASWTAIRSSRRTACCFNRRPISRARPRAWPRRPDHRRAGRRSDAARTDAGAVVRSRSACNTARPSSTICSRALTMSADTVDQVLAGQPASFSWHVLLTGQTARTEASCATSSRSGRCWTFTALRARPRGERRHPQSGGRPQARHGLSGARAPDRPGGDGRRRVRHRAGGRGGQRARARSSIVLIILWLALHSPRIILAVFLNLVVGLAVTAALGLHDGRGAEPDLDCLRRAVSSASASISAFSSRSATDPSASRTAIFIRRWSSTAEKIGAPLTLAAAAVAAGFLSFFPTDYKGVSELGQIAGVGMLIAYVTSITVLPALLTILQPPGEAEQIGYRVLAPVDRFLERHRIPVIAGTGLVALGRIAAALLPHLRFQSDQSAKPGRRVGRDLPRPADRSERSAPMRSTWCCRTPTMSTRSPISFARSPRSTRSRRCRTSCRHDQERKLALIRGLARQLQTGAAVRRTRRARRPMRRPSRR